MNTQDPGRDLYDLWLQALQAHIPGEVSVYDSTYYAEGRAAWQKLAQVIGFGQPTGSVRPHGLLDQGMHDSDDDVSDYPYSVDQIRRYIDKGDDIQRWLPNMTPEDIQRFKDNEFSGDVDTF